MISLNTATLGQSRPCHRAKPIRSSHADNARHYASGQQTRLANAAYSNCLRRLNKLSGNAVFNHIQRLARHLIPQNKPVMTNASFTGNRSAPYDLNRIVGVFKHFWHTASIAARCTDRSRISMVKSSSLTVMVMGAFPFNGVTGTMHQTE